MDIVCLLVSIGVLAVAITYSIRKMDIFNPLLLFSFPMVFQIWIYMFFYNEYKLCITTYAVVILNLICYFFGYFVSEAITRNARENVKDNVRHPIYYNDYFYKLFLILSVLGFVLGVGEMFKNGLNGDLSFFTNIRINEIYGDGKSFFTKYSTVFLFVVSLIYFYNYLIERKRSKRKNIKKIVILIFLFLFLIVSSLFTMARTELLTYVLAITCLYFEFTDKKRRNVITFIKKYRSLLVLALAMIVAFALLGAMSTRAVSMDITDENFYLYKYCGYTLVTFDKYYVENPGINSPILLLGPIGKLLEVMGVQLNTVQIVPIEEPYNVAGYYCTIYSTCGVWGIIFINIFLGFFVSVLYNQAKKNGGYILIFYTTYVYTIIISFFAYQYANTLYLYIIAIILILKVDTRLKFHTGKLVARKEGENSGSNSTGICI